jgi:hypothetical protein
MEQIPFETLVSALLVKKFAALYLEDYCRVRKGPPLIPILGQMNPFHILAHYSSENLSRNISSTLKFYK